MIHELLINKVSIIANDDIIGVIKSDLNYNGPFQCFIYEKTNNNIYQKRVSINYNSIICSFLLSQNNNVLIILYYTEINYRHYEIDIYEYKKLKLIRKYKENIFRLNSDTLNFLFNINQNLFTFVHINKTPSRSSCPKSKIILYDINNENKITFFSKYFHWRKT